MAAHRARLAAALLTAVLATAGSLPPAEAAGPATETLESVWMATPHVGHGIIVTQPANAAPTSRCLTSVATTTDGGRSFANPISVMTWLCGQAAGTPQLTFDGRGDGFVFGPQLFATHDAGLTWRRVAVAGTVIAVAARGRSVWALAESCRHSGRVAPARCPAFVITSSDGGRTWTRNHALPPTLSVPAWLNLESALGQSLLVRPSGRLGLIVSVPRINPLGHPDAADLWTTTDGGATWTRRSLLCGIDALSAMVTAVGRTWFGVCAGQPSAGFQAKSVARSTNGGRTWALLDRCIPPSAGACANPLDDGYLGVLVATTPRVVYESGLRSALNVSHDGGRTWTATLEALAADGDGITQLWMAGRHGLALSAPANRIAATSDGGARWHTAGVRLPATRLPA